MQSLAAILILLPPLSRPLQCCFPVVFKSRNSLYKCAYHSAYHTVVSYSSPYLPLSLLTCSGFKERYTEGASFLPKMVYKKVRGQTETPHNQFFLPPPPPI